MVNNELVHHGILGMKWGVRRYQNKDGSLTPAGKKRYLNTDGTYTNKGQKIFLDEKGNDTEAGKKYKKSVRIKKAINYEDNLFSDFDNTSEGKKLRKEYDDAYETYIGAHSFNSSADEKKAMNRFITAEKKYLQNQYRYVGENMVKKYSLETLSDVESQYYGNKQYTSAKEYVNDRVKEWELHRE